MNQTDLEKNVATLSFQHPVFGRNTTDTFESRWKYYRSLMVVPQVLSALRLGSCSRRGSVTLSPGAWAFICPFQALALQKTLSLTEVSLQHNPH